MLLIEELSSHDLDTLQKEMEDDEVGGRGGRASLGYALAVINHES